MDSIASRKIPHLIDHDIINDRPILASITNKNKVDSFYYYFKDIIRHSKTFPKETECTRRPHPPVLQRSHSAISNSRQWDLRPELYNESSLSENSDEENVPPTDVVMSCVPGAYTDICDDSTKSLVPNSGSIDPSELNTQPIVSQLASDIVRAAFSNRVQLEDLIAECRQSDFVFSYSAQSHDRRMLEAADYVVGIMAFEQLRENKECFKLHDFLSSNQHPDLDADCLTTLADWLAELQCYYPTNPETMHLAWCLFIAFLEHSTPMSKNDAHLMLCSSLLVAYKLEEREMPSIGQLLYAMSNTFQPRHCLMAERTLLITLDFAVHRPNPYIFLRRYQRVLDAEEKEVLFMTEFLLEAGIHSYLLSIQRESRKAAAALWLARIVLANPSYSKWLQSRHVERVARLLRSSRPCCVYFRQCRDAAGPCLSHHRPDNICEPQLAINIKSSSLISLQNSQPLVTLSSQVDEWIGTGQLIDQSHTSHIADALKTELQIIKSEEAQRAPYWPPILEHITGYSVCELLPIALLYHKIAMQLIAEVSRGGTLFDQNVDLATAVSHGWRPQTRPSRSARIHPIDYTERCASPGGHFLRRQTVSKYCNE